MDQLKSTDISMILGMVEISDMPVDPNMPLATIGDEVRTKEVAAVEFEAETDEEQLGVYEKATYEGLIKVEEARVDSAVQISLADTTMVESSVTDTPGTNAEDQSVAPGTNAPTNRGTA
ncbi:hypothetical protein H5410_055898 [Solanum commersonii]|uniref:Polyprotein protein n=1 Tax=Solanum commersonii TaxID=4109 RepID=A0A9J5WKQ5_SOLCO|nr:hypothetical protein H5410_055898 [Solanum commersonii]